MSCKELTHWKRLWCWEGLGAEREGDDRRWDGWMASLTRWMWVWVNSGRWWWTGRPGVLSFMGSQRVGHDWVTELTEVMPIEAVFPLSLIGLFWVWASSGQGQNAWTQGTCHFESSLYWGRKSPSSFWSCLGHLPVYDLRWITTSVVSVLSPAKWCWIL